MNTVKERDFINGAKIGGKNPFFLIAGPCVMESYELLKEVAVEMKSITSDLNIPFVFKSSFDKANRSSIHSYRGPGLEKGIQYFEKLKGELNVPVLTDIHETFQVEPLKNILDIYQIPAFLCRQTDLIEAAAKTKKWINVKKGQFLSPDDCRHIKSKSEEVGNYNVTITERGTSFGYNNLVFDIRGIPILHHYDIPVVFDATHSAQLPGGAGNITGGVRQYIPHMVRGAVAAGIEGIFMEVHPDPDKAKSDSTTQLPLSQVRTLLKSWLEIDRLIKSQF
jgi:2-dehydro-3-deoxyphosphooctonate aldolase (KDO 8-P synthase)